MKFYIYYSIVESFLWGSQGGSPYTGEGCRMVSNFGYDAQHRKGILYGNQTLGSMSILLDGHFEINSEGKSGGSTHTGEGCRMVTIFEPAAQHRMGIISESQTSGSMSMVADATPRIQLWGKVSLQVKVVVARSLSIPATQH